MEAIIAREGRAGTDAMLAALTAAQAKGAILVKAMKPNQLVSMDPPAIGESTVVNAAKAGLAGILVEAGAASSSMKTAFAPAATSLAYSSTPTRFAEK